MRPHKSSFNAYQRPIYTRIVGYMPIIDSCDNIYMYNNFAKHMSACSSSSYKLDNTWEKNLHVERAKGWHSNIGKTKKTWLNHVTSLPPGHVNVLCNSEIDLNQSRKKS